MISKICLKYQKYSSCSKMVPVSVLYLMFLSLFSFSTCNKKLRQTHYIMMIKKHASTSPIHYSNNKRAKMNIKHN